MILSLFVLSIFVYITVYISMSSKALLSIILQTMSSKFPFVLNMDCILKKCNDTDTYFRYH
jgi:hypothetical protein